MKLIADIAVFGALIFVCYAIVYAKIFDFTGYSDMLYLRSMLTANLLVTVALFATLNRTKV